MATMRHLLPGIWNRPAVRGGRTSHPLDMFQDEINRMFDDFWRGSGDVGVPASNAWAVQSDVSEDENEVTLTAELPGLSENDVEISLEDGVLTLKGEKHDERKDEGKAYRMAERRYGAFSRSFLVGRNIDESKVSAEFKDGVLTVHLPRTEGSKGRRIEIKKA